jgi:hypothetical protein
LTTVLNVYLKWHLCSQQEWPIDKGYLFLPDTWSHFWYIQRSIITLLSFVFPIGLMGMMVVHFLCCFIYVRTVYYMYTPVLWYRGSYGSAVV